MFELYMRRFRKLSAALLAVLMLCGCVQEPPAPSTNPTSPSGTTAPPTRPTQPEDTQPTTEPPITEPPVITPPPTLKPVTHLKCTTWKTYPDLLSLGGGIVLASRNYYSDEKNRIVNTLELIDVYNDKLLATVNNDSSREAVMQSFPDGFVVIADTRTSTMFVYDNALALSTSFQVPNTNGFFSYDRCNYYFVENETLYRMDVATGNRGRMALQTELHLESLLGIHPTEDLLVARVHLSPYTTDYALALINVKNGKLRMLTDDLTHMWFTGDHFYGVEMNDNVYGYDVYWGRLSGGDVQRITTDKLGGDTVGYNLLPGSHLLLRRKAPEEGQWNTTIFDLANGGVAADMDAYDFIDALFFPTYLSEEQLILGLSKDGYFYDPVIIDPKALTFGDGVEPEVVPWDPVVDTEIVQNYGQLPKLPEALKDAGKLADEIKETYGITILLGSQVADPCAFTGCKAQINEDAAQITAALNTLKTELAKYPSDFFTQLQDSAENGELVFCLTGTIEEPVDSVGVTRWNRGHCYLTVDVTAADMEKTIHHEIWHGVEMLLPTDAFDPALWNVFLPNNYRYYGKYDKGYEELTPWTYTGGAGKKSYFVSPYARINVYEDRACIMEYVMTGQASELMEAAMLKAKYQIICDTLRRHFDSDGWSNVFWEQYL